MKERSTKTSANNAPSADGDKGAVRSAKIQFTVQSEAKMLAFGARLAALLCDGGFVAIDGQLGAGKTVLVRGLAAALGIAHVQSPTFTLIKEYATRPPLYHFDVYRMDGENELYAVGYEDYLAADNALIVMEWATLVPAALPTERLDIFIRGDGDTARTVTLTAYGNRYCDIIGAL